MPRASVQADVMPTKRILFPYFEGVNSIVGHNIAKKVESYHSENARMSQIGIMDKREGTTLVGNNLAFTASYGINFFSNDGTSNQGLYRVAKTGGITSIYYLNNSNVWTALTGFGTSIFELGSSTTQFDITNPSGTTFRYTWDGTGTDPDIDWHMRVGSTIVINAQNFSTGNNGTFTVTGVAATYFEVTNAAGVAENNKTIGTGSIVVSGNRVSMTQAEGNLFMVNGDNDNLYVEADGTTVTTSASASGHLYGSPKARKINYYKDKLYVADYAIGGTRYRNGIMMSSVPVGIVALVDGDHLAGSVSIKVTDTKYIHASDTLQVYRGFVLIATLTVTAKTETTITVTATGVDLLSSDELWVNGTFSGQKKFRWADNPFSGIPVKQYDTMKLSGARNDRIRMLVNVGNVMAISNTGNFAVWDNYTLRNFDINVGCVSDEGFVKALGTLWFVHYSGIYTTAGDRPKLMSAKVERYIKGATKAGLEASAMGAQGTSVFAYIGAVSLYKQDGSFEKTISDVVLEYDMRQEDWSVHTGVTMTAFTTFLTTNPDTLVAEVTEAGGSYTYQYMTPTVTTDAFAGVNGAKNIPFRIDTCRIYLSQEIENLAYPQEVVIEADRGGDIRVFTSLDDEQFYELEGSAQKGAVILKMTPLTGERTNPRCRQMRLSIRDFSANMCRLSRMAIIYGESMERENTRPDGVAVA